MLQDGAVYVFHFKKDPFKVLDVYGGKTENGTNVQIANYHRSNNQRFQALKRGNYYIFKDLNSGKVLDVDEGKVGNGVNIQIWEQHNGDNQKWKVIKVDNNCYSIQSKLNPNYYLDVKYGGDNETNVWLYEGNNTDAQKFYIKKKELYRYRVGVQGVMKQEILKKINITHAAFLLGTDLFEYGTVGLPRLGFEMAKNFIGINPTEMKSTFKRERNFNRKNDFEFDWDTLGNTLNGTTYTQPDELDAILRYSGDWTSGKYNVLVHNCHDFVRECLTICGANSGTAYKPNPVFRAHK